MVGPEKGGGSGAPTNVRVITEGPWGAGEGCLGLSWEKTLLTWVASGQNRQASAVPSRSGSFRPPIAALPASSTDPERAPGALPGFTLHLDGSYGCQPSEGIPATSFPQNKISGTRVCGCPEVPLCFHLRGWPRHRSAGRASSALRKFVLSD